MANKYPIHFVNKYINKRWNLLKNCNPNITRNNIPINNNYRNKIFIKIPFRFGLYQKIKEIIDDNTFHVIPQLNKDMTKIIRKGKIDTIQNKTGIVYKLVCNDCDSV